MPADRLFHPKFGHSEKVCSLNHLEFRVWATYQVASDDYGVMRKSAVTIQAANDALVAEKPQRIEDALTKMVRIGLLHEFEHQGRTYVYQLTWQNEQRVKHPRDTMQPAPPLDKCSPATRKLFQSGHPLLRKDGDETSEVSRTNLGNISEVPQTEKSEVGSLARTRTRETANGYRLTANGKEGVQGEFPFDVWLEELKAAYPESSVTSGHLTVTAFVDAVLSHGTPLATFAVMLANLENQKRGHQWRVKRMIPLLQNWLRDGRWEQQHDEQAPVSEQLAPKTNRTIAAAAEILRGES